MAMKLEDFKILKLAEHLWKESAAKRNVLHKLAGHLFNEKSDAKFAEVSCHLINQLSVLSLMINQIQMEFHVSLGVKSKSKLHFEVENEGAQGKKQLDIYLSGKLMTCPESWETAQLQSNMKPLDR